VLERLRPDVASRAPDDGRLDGPLIALKRAGVARNGRPILVDVDLLIEPGEIVTIVGPNGAGKTTLLKVALGLVRPDSGSVWRRPGLRLGYVPQRLHVDPALPLKVRRLMTLTQRHPATAIEAALAETGVAHLADADVHALSGGEFQRVLIARALLARPDILVLDEPVQGVDFSGEVALYERIASIRDRYGCAVLLVSHDLHVVMAATDRVICLNGHVCCAGVPHEVAENPEYVRLFGPRAAGTLALYRHRHDHAHALSGEVVTNGSDKPEADPGG
jgi:zinc transport system ATP-binding protein